MVTASIVTYRTPLAEIEHTIRYASASAIDRLYIVDNSSDETLRRLCSDHETLVSYMGSENIGYGAAHNLAIRQAAADGSRYHLIMNSDIEAGPDDVERIISFMETHVDVGMLQPCIVNPDGSLQHTARLLPTPFDLILRRFLPGGWFKKRRDRYLLKSLDHTRPFTSNYLQGSFIFCRTEALTNAGLFDERFFMYPEDIDLTRRLSRHHTALYWPDVKVIHHHAAASYSSSRMLRVHIINMIRYFNKWGWIFDGERRRLNRLTLSQNQLLYSRRDDSGTMPL